MTFTIGKWRTRSGQEAEIIAVGREGRLLGYLGHETVPCWWTPEGRICGNENECYGDLVPPAPPKLEPIVDWVLRSKDGEIERQGLTEANAREEAARYSINWPGRAPYTIHRRITEQVE